MPEERLKSVIAQMQNRTTAVMGRGEEATKQALVLPMLDALGWDIWNPSEVCPEYDADFATRRGAQKERVDLAIILENAPRIFIEVKSADVSLDAHGGQLSRYFNAVPTVSLAILTNGLEWRFYTDTGEPNLMDSQPFHVLRLDAVDQGLQVLARFHRSAFSPEAIRDYATELEYTARIVSFLRAQLDLRNREPSEHLVRWVLGSEDMYDGRIVASVVDRFRPITKNALQIVIRDIIRRSVLALDKGMADEDRPADDDAPETDLPASDAADAGDSDEDAKDRTSRIVTTEGELTAFAMVEGIFHRWFRPDTLIYDASSRKEVPIELGYRDTTGYFGVYFNKSSWWFARLVIEARQPWVGFNVAPEALDGLIPVDMAILDPHPFATARIAIGSVDDIPKLERVFIAAMDTLVASKAL